MKKIIFLIVLSAIIVSCDDYLNVTDYTQKSSQNFPVNYDDCNQALAAAYTSMGLGEPFNSFMIAALASDDALGGGAPFNDNARSYDRWMKYDPDMFKNLWKNAYRGIFRANKLRESLDQVDFSSSEQYDLVLGETYFLRAFFYFNLVRLFGEVPLILSAQEPVNYPKSPASEIYPHIASDLTKAIELLPSVAYNSDPSRLGHATKWAAEALMARVYLFYTGYYQQSELPLAEEGSVTKQMVIEYLNDLMDNSGHGLVDDYRNLWLYTNDYTKEDYKYTAGKGLSWAGDGNKEIVWSMKHGVCTYYDDAQNNRISQWFGVRGQHENTIFPFDWGFGFGPVNPIMVDQWILDEPNDTVRRWGSVIDMNDPREGVRDYFNNDPMLEETKLYQKKYSIIQVYTDKSDPDTANWVWDGYDNVVNGSSLGSNSSQEQIFIRYADVLLMHSELTETGDGINQVRDRAGLSPVSYSLENLQKERRYELAFEGIRYWDLLRWYRSEAGVIIDQNQNGAPVFDIDEPATYEANLTDRIRATGGFMQIPEFEIGLSGGVLEQNTGWVGNEGNLIY